MIKLISVLINPKTSLTMTNHMMIDSDKKTIIQIIESKASPNLKRDSLQHQFCGLQLHQFKKKKKFLFKISQY